MPLLQKFRLPHLRSAGKESRSLRPSQDIFVERRTATTSKMLQRVAHLTSVHPVFDIRIFHKECKTLAAAGYDVTLIAPHTREECIGGIRIEPVPSTGSRRRRMTDTVWQVYRKALRSKAKLFHFHDPELLPVGILLKLAGKRVVYDAHEHVADDILTKSWIRPQLRGFISMSARMVEKITSRVVDAVVGATPAIVNNFPPRKTVLVQNFPILGELICEDPVPYERREAVLLYVGSITEARGVREMVCAATRNPDRLNAKLLLVGNVSSASLESEMAACGAGKVEHLGFLDRQTVARLAGRARAGLVLFHPGPNHEDSQPNKLFEYMSAGLPVVVSNFQSWRALIDDVGCGLTVNPLNVTEIANALTWILDHPTEAAAMGKRGQTAVASTYNWGTQVHNLLGLYEGLLRP